MGAAIDGMARKAFLAVHAEIGEDVSEEWIRGFLERYSSDMGLRLAKANMNELTRVVSAAEDDEAFNALNEKLGSWYSKGDSGRAELMAKNEAALCMNEAKIAAYRHAGYTSKWVTGANCCEACQRLNGQMIMTLKPPLHMGCSCYVTVGDKVKPEWLTKEFNPGIIESTEEVREWINTIGKNLGVNAGQQRKHYKGSNENENYKKSFAVKGEYGPSILTITDSEVAALVMKYGGTGEIKGTNNKWDMSERITTNDSIIGICVNNKNGKEATTINFKIHYGRSGYHIVPDYPKR